ncbi:unnamed protein product, partial [Sphenostylis stenocarpa]
VSKVNNDDHIEDNEVDEVGPSSLVGEEGGELIPMMLDMIPYVSLVDQATPSMKFKELKGAWVIYSTERRSCQDCISFFSLLKSKPLGPLRGSNPGACKSQKHIVSPPKITSPVGDRIRYLPKPVGP